MDYQLMRVIPKVVKEMDKSANYLDMGCLTATKPRKRTIAK
jgi:hypothetical protein